MDVMIIILYGLGALFISAALLPLIIKRIFNEGSVASLCFGGAAVLCGFLLGFVGKSNVLYSVALTLTVLLGLCFLAGLVLSAMMLFTALKKPSAETGQGNVFVLILGCRLYGNTPTRALKGRVDRGLKILSSDDNIIAVVSGGQGSDEQMSEALAMKQYLMKKGKLAESRIITEDRSTSTAENLRFSLPLIKEYCNEKGLSAGKIIIVSDGFHLFRTKLLAKEQGIENAEYGAAFTPSVDFPVQWVREILAILDLFLRKFSASGDNIK